MFSAKIWAWALSLGRNTMDLVLTSPGDESTSKVLVTVTSGDGCEARGLAHSDDGCPSASREICSPRLCGGVSGQLVGGCIRLGASETLKRCRWNASMLTDVVTQSAGVTAPDPGSSACAPPPVTRSSGA